MIVLNSVTHKPFSLPSLQRAKRLANWRAKLAKRELDDETKFPATLIQFAEPSLLQRLLKSVA